MFSLVRGLQITKIGVMNEREEILIQTGKFLKTRILFELRVSLASCSISLPGALHTKVLVFFSNMNKL